MLQKTRGIILHSVKYSDNATIVMIYTQLFGKISYMVYGANKKKSKFRTAFLQPLSLVEIDVFHSYSKNIQSIKDVRITYPLTGISSHPVKNALALFVSEVLYRSLKQTDPDENLYNFLENSIQVLDCCEEGIANFHLVFLMQLTKYLGFEPNTEGNNNQYFDLMNGIFVKELPPHKHFLATNLTLKLIQIINTNYLNLHSLSLTRIERLKLIESITDYYKLHVTDFQGLTSTPVLHSLFD